MAPRWSKSLLVAAFSIVSTFFFNTSRAQGKIDPSSIILDHIADGHEFHFFTFHGKVASIPLPVVLYSPQRGWSVFMASHWEHGAVTYAGYRLLTEEFITANHLDEKVYKNGKVVAVNTDGTIDPSSKVYDFSISRNVVQMLITVILLIWVMGSVAKKYKAGTGVKTAPTGVQGVVEPIVVFLRDEVGKVNLGDRYEKYMPFLLTVFFFILINALIGLIPGTANVVGNIAFTGALGILAFLVIMFSTGKHYWLHILNPPVPLGVKPIMIPVEILGIFTKPFALIIRLFANMISGHIIILSFIILIFVFGAMNTALGWGTSPFFILLAVFIYLIELLVAFIQAYIFANLTAVFVGLAFEGGHEDGHGHAQEAVVI
ncbi:MAG TPA: F0F1 ATP synthase subunit A [Puia sp.]|jgi:F-type H+-transporting ATPase subunit a|nr:F0F1 ATP synthase subunit A [Puia sp.]